MTILKSATVAALVATIAAPAFAETIRNNEQSRLYEADYQAVLAEVGYATGVAVYGQNDADYDVYLTDAALFQPVLGHNDADYEAHLNHAAFAEMQVASR